ncbi:MAG: DMT family transporter, partial [Candidatus Aminicenantes bacterium]
LKLILLGIIGNTVFQMFFIHGMNLTTASNTSIIMAMTPVFVALLSSLTKQERIHWLTWLGIGISFVGFYFVITRQPGGISLSGKGIRGDLMIFLGNMCWAIYTVFSKPILERMSPLKLTTLTMVMGTVFYVPFCLKDVLHLRLTAISTPAWGALFYSGLFALAICYVIWYFSVKIVGNIKTAIYGYLIPVFTVLFAYIFISETITYWQAVGALIILVGVYLARSP